jgi:hypothetical protein
VTQYQFTIEQLTAGDFFALTAAAKKNDVERFAIIADRYTVGGILDLPFTELAGAIQQFTKEFTEYVQRPGGGASPDVSRLLKQALGDGDG